MNVRDPVVNRIALATPGPVGPKRWIMAGATMLLVTLIFFCFTLQADPPIVDAEPKGIPIDLPDFPEGAAYVLGRLSNKELLNIERSEPVHLAIMIREGLDASLRQEAIAELAKIRQTDELAQILDGILRADRSNDRRDGALNNLIQFLLAEPPAELEKSRTALVTLATDADRELSREAGYAALILADGDVEASWPLAEKSENGLVDLLNGIPMIPDPNARAVLYPKVERLLHNAPALDIRRSAILSIASIPGREAETFATLASFVSENDERDTAIEALQQFPSARWPKSRIPDLADSIVKYATGVAPEERNSPEFKRALQLGNELANLLPPESMRKVREALGALGIRTVMIRAIPHLMLYDKIHIIVEAGEPIEITFENPDIMQHNLVIVAPGAMEEIGLAASRMIADAMGGDGETFVPDSDKVLYATELIGSRKSTTLAFVAPEAIGDYPYLCTFPGHWVTMNGVMHVVDDVNAWIAENPDKSPGSELARRQFVREWKLDDLVYELDKLESGRSVDRGEELFTAASCVICHQIRKVGGVIGPDLTDVSERLEPAAMLAEILEPSKIINEEYRTWRIDLTNGIILSGIITDENAEAIRVVENPLDETEGIQIPRNRISDMTASSLSAMPMGLLSTFTREEILDLVAYLRSDGDPSD